VFTLSSQVSALATTLATSPLSGLHAVTTVQQSTHMTGGTVVGVALASATLLAVSVGPLMRLLAKLMIIAMAIGLVAILVAVFIVADSIASH
jgi:hypothetical protein